MSEVKKDNKEITENSSSLQAIITRLRSDKEENLRDIKVPWPKTLEELNEIINALSKREHDYGTSVYAMSIAAVATFYYMSHVVGSTGFQASCADLDILKRTRNLECGFSIIDYSKLLYPQYFNDETFPTKEMLLNKNKEVLSKAAAVRLEESKGKAHPEVLSWWKKITNLCV
jgi:hypothetical protein